MNPIFHLEAELEVSNAAEFYRVRSPNIARRFREAFDDCLLQIVEFPESFPIVFERAHARRASLSGFPYRIVYAVEPDAIYVFALEHERQEPLYWLRRLEP